MKDKEKTKGQLIDELVEMRQRIAEFKALESERKRAKEGILESEEEFKAIFDSVRDGIALLDMTGKVIKINKRIVEVTGYNEEEAVGKRIKLLKMFTLPSLAKILSNFAKIISGQQPPPYDVEVYTKTGKKLNVELHGSLFRKRGKVVGMVGVIRNITERKQVEQALRESEEKYRTILESIEDGYYEVDIRGNFTFFNDSMCRILGYTEDEMIGMNNRHYTDQENAKKVYQTFNKIYTTATPHKGFDWEFIRRDGTKGYANTSISLMKDAEGRRIGFWGILRDVTARKRAEEVLEESEERFRALVEESPLGISLIDKDGYYKYINPKFIEMFGYTLEDIPTGREWFKKAYPDKEYRHQVISAWISDFEKFKSGESRPPTFNVKCKDSSKKIIHFRPVTMETGDQFVIYEDITERMRAEEELKGYAAKLERSNQELEQFAYIASHDLQEPLRMVASYTQLLARRYKGKLDSDADEFIAYAVDGATRMKALINDLLAYSRIGTNGKDFEPTDCEAVFDRTLENLQKAVEESGAKVTHDPLPTVMADDMQLGQLFQNLIGNAIKFRSEELPRIHISAKPISDFGFRDVELESKIKDPQSKIQNCYVFSVRDNGIGIDPEFTGRIFIIFQRLHKRREYPGTGIGLTICKKIVERHGGRIWVESARKRLNVLFYNSEERRKIAMDSQALGKPVEILLVEDNPGDVRLTQEAFKDGKMLNKLHVAEDGMEALAFLKREGKYTGAPRPELILLDLNLPGKDGRDVLAEIKVDRDLKRIPVVILTTSRSEEDILRSYDLNANCYITKPVELDKFIEVVKYIEDFWLTIVKLPT